MKEALRSGGTRAAGWRVVVVLAALCALGANPAMTAEGHTCRGCHDRTDRASDGSATKPDARICADCHGEILRGEASPAARIASRGRALAYGHLQNGGEAYEAVAPGLRGRSVRLDCLSCHAPHPNGQRHQLRVSEAEGRGFGDLAEADAVTRLCLSCHADQGRFKSGGGSYSRHPVGVPSEDARRVRAARLPLFDVRGTEDESDDVIGCATCHFVHGSPEENLLRWSRHEEREACGSCHRDIYDPGLPPGTTVAELR